MSTRRRRRHPAPRSTPKTCAASVRSLLGIDRPILQAPMAGMSTPAMAAAVTDAGGLGALGIGAATVEQAAAMLAEVGIIAFVGRWNNYLVPLILLNTNGLYPWPLGLMDYQGQYSTAWQLVLAFINPDAAAVTT